MYRIQQSCEIKYGHFAAYLSACEELNALCAFRGWRTSQIFTPLGGTNNRIVLETDYPTLNDF